MQPTTAPITYQGGQTMPAIGSTGYGQPAVSPLPTTAPSTVSAADLTSNPGAYQVPPPINSNSYSSFVNSLTGGMPALQSNVNTAQSAVDQQLQDLMSANNQLGQKGTEEQGLLNSAGVPEFQKQLADINTQMTNAANAFKQQNFTTLNTPGSYTQYANSLLSRDQQQQAITLGALSATSQALQGNINNAMSIADKTIAMKYDALQASYNNKLLFFQQNKDQLTAVQQKLATQQADVLQAGLAKLQADKQQEQENVKNAIAYGVSGQSLADIITGKTSFADVLAQNNASTSTTGTSEATGSNGTTATGVQIPPNGMINGVPVTAEAANASSNGNDAIAYQLANSLASPSQYISGRSATTPAGRALLQRVNAISMAQTGKPFDAEASQSAYDFRHSTQYNNYTAAAPSALRNIQAIAADARILNLTGLSGVNSAKISAIASGLFPASQEQKTAAADIQSKLAQNKDDIGLLLGTGTGSDMKLAIGGLIFDPNKNPVTNDQLTKNVTNTITQKLGDYYAKAGVKDPSQYLQQDTINLLKTAGLNQLQTPTAQEGDIKSWNGVNYKVVNGVWTPQ